MSGNAAHAPIQEAIMKTVPFLCLLAALTFAPAFCQADELATNSTVQNGEALTSEWWQVQIAKVAPPAAQPGREWWRTVTAKNPACHIYSDGCQMCATGGDSFECSNPGIACIGGEWSCVR
jgi:hypothetical protein